MKTISIPVGGRSGMLARCLKSIGEAEGHEEWSLVFTCEPNSNHFSVPHCEAAFCFTNNFRLGCRVNTFYAIACAHVLGSTFNLYLEDDVVISPDALLMADAFAASGKAGILCLRRWHNAQQSIPDEVTPANHGLLGDGFAYHRKDWLTIAKYWFDDRPGQGGQMWDWSVDAGLVREGVPCWRPWMNRSQNIGTQGTHTATGADLNHFGGCYLGEPVRAFKFTP